MIIGDLDESLESPERMMGQSSSAVAWCIAWCMSWTWGVRAHSWCAFGSGVRMVSVACLKKSFMFSVFESKGCHWNMCLSRLSVGSGASWRYVVNGGG